MRSRRRSWSWGDLFAAIPARAGIQTLCAHLLLEHDPPLHAGLSRAELADIDHHLVVSPT
jgi:hypothetical protein